MASSSSSLRVSSLSHLEVIEKINQSEQEVQSVLKEPRSVVRLLLHNFKWEKETLLDAISKDKDSVLKLVKNIEFESSNASQVGVPGSCHICYSTLSKRDMVKDGPVCGHPFCTDCWFQYLSIQISANEKCVGLECPMTNCKSLVEDSLIVRVFTKFPQMVTSYRKLLATSFITRSVTLSWCPSCSETLELLQPGPSAVTCPCGYVFCFQCCRPDHFLVSCALMDDWERQVFRNQNQSVVTIVKSKKCPACRMDIERISGCPHMNCSRCHSQFCWDCLQLWDDHHNCVTVEEDKTEVEQEIVGGLSESQRFKLFKVVFKAKKEYFGCLNLNSETIYHIQHLKSSKNELPVRHKNSYIDKKENSETPADSAYDILIDEGILSLQKFFSELPFCLHLSDIVSAIQKEQSTNHKLGWFPTDLMLEAAEMINTIQHITMYSQILSFYVGCRPFLGGLPHPDLQDLGRFGFLSQIPQKIKFAERIEHHIIALEEQHKLLSTLVLDVTTGFLSMLCCQTRAESSLVMTNFRGNVQSLHEEFIGVMKMCKAHKTKVVNDLESELLEHRFHLKK